MKKYLENKKGSLTVWLVYVLPVLVMAFALFANVGILVDTKMRMQSAVDRGAYAGSAYLAHVMDNIAHLNWDFRKLYLDKKSLFAKASKDSKGLIDKHINELNQRQNELYEKMNSLLDEGYRNAYEIAKDVAFENLKNLPQILNIKYDHIRGIPEKKMFDMVNDCNKSGICNNFEILYPHEIVGNDYDPKEFKQYSHQLNTYLIKSEKKTAILARLSALFSVPLLPKVFKSSLIQTALSFVFSI